MHIIRLGRSMTKSLQISCIISGISNHSKMDTKHITGNIIHMIHSTKFGTINYYTSFLPLCPCLLTIVPYPWSIRKGGPAIRNDNGGFQQSWLPWRTIRPSERCRSGFVLVGALFILGDRVKCIPIYLVPLESRYSRRWCLGQHVQLISNIRNDNGGFQQSWLPWRTIRPCQRCRSGFLFEGHE
mgnify:CR=1 FL=1